ncbi:GNAT family N-acetyltransferase [Chelatococcus sp. SYSU_G07232]|uniref:GNAT family N-acetyltransferase n=1 Tax=Chelatococcus albus TaxID=3047466 RepID=A0ABT7AH80_9HYPH|nr:GNAT family N-acetyltransferase [Chelatococcus sp. SYSU_G07232]MDJ1158736.1 GNAT family N-acetyltransferase [Chelatococcus sp. SYSU_G07232]
MTAAPYTFRPVTEADLGLLRRWMEAPHVAEWWGEIEEEIEGIRADFADPAVEAFIVSHGGRPIGFLQCYVVHAEADHPYADRPLGARGIDQFIGEADMIGCGQGPAFIRRFCDMLERDGVPCVVTDPNPLNARAVRAYEKAGFRPLEERDTPFGRVLLMMRGPVAERGKR